MARSVVKKPEHFHRWAKDWSETDLHCACGAIQVSEEELDHRKKAWQSYFELVWTTPAYLRYQAIREAWAAHNLPEIKKLVGEAGKALRENDYLERPHFPDPTTWSKYVVV